MRAGRAPLRVLALVTDGFGGHGGIARYNQALLQALAGVDHVAGIEVVARYGESGPGMAGPSAIVQRTAPGKAAYLARVAASASRRRFDLVFCGHLHMAPLAAAVAVRQGCPWWLQVHGIEAWQAPGRAVRVAVGRAALVTAVSRFTRRRLLAWADLEPERVRVLPNVVEARFAPGPKPDALVRRLGLEGRRVLLTVGRLAASERYKGHDRVIEALAALADRHPDLVYLIAGDGDDRPRLEALAAACGMAGRVRFLGQVPDQDLPELYRLADLFVMPSTGEGFGIVFLEAMASGVPALGGNADGSRDPLQDGSLGKVAPVERLDEALAACLARPAPDRDRLAREVRRIFGPEAFARRLGDLVRTIGA
ncbi:MAG: glycosyltransferase family 4 protein [Geminicoccaceae bacterium]|nr:glycosyltransferase family 4 protein [Geminicoccaceae bacterium]